MKEEVASDFCGALFGEEKVNNLVALFSRYCSLFQLVRFSVGCCNSLSVSPLTREDYIHTPVQGPDGTVMQPSRLLVLFMARAVTHVVPCGKLLLHTLAHY